MTFSSDNSENDYKSKKKIYIFLFDNQLADQQLIIIEINEYSDGDSYLIMHTIMHAIHDTM